MSDGSPAPQKVTQQIESSANHYLYNKETTQIQTIQTAAIPSIDMNTPFANYLLDVIEKTLHLKTTLVSTLNNLVIDCRFGAAIPVWTQLKERLKLPNCTLLNNTFDSNFGLKNPNPSNDENLEDLRSILLKKSCKLRYRS